MRKSTLSTSSLIRSYYTIRATIFEKVINALFVHLSCIFCPYCLPTMLEEQAGNKKQDKQTNSLFPWWPSNIFENESYLRNQDLILFKHVKHLYLCCVNLLVERSTPTTVVFSKIEVQSSVQKFIRISVKGSITICKMIVMRKIHSF